MHLSDLIHKRSVVLSLQADDLKSTMEALTASIGLTKARREEVVKALMERENQNSTLMTDTIAFPHARISDFREFHVAVGLSPKGVPFGERRAKLIFLLIASPEKNPLILQMRAAIARAILSDPDLESKLIDARSSQEVLGLLRPIQIELDKPPSAQDIMREATPTVTLESSLYDVLSRLNKSNLTELPVVDSRNRLLGCVGVDEITGLGIPSYFSLMEDVSFIVDYEPFLSVFKQEHTQKVGEILHTDITRVTPEAHVVSLAFLFRKNRIRYLYVVDGEKYVGVVTRRQLLHKILMP